MTKNSLFFVAILIPERIASEIREFQDYASMYFGSSAALRSPPHVTVVAPFSVPEERRQVLFETLKTQGHLGEPIEMILDGFDAFGKGVIFANVEPDPLLEKLSSNSHRALTGHGFSLRDERHPYHPHVTVAFKDLNENMFEKAWAHFQPILYRRMFAADRIHLLEHLDGSWKPIGEFTF